MADTHEYFGDMKFKSNNVAGQKTREDWLRRAATEYAMSRFALRILNMDDNELEAFVHELGTTSDERGNAALDLYQWFDGWKDGYEAGVDILADVTARLLVIAERALGPQEWQKQH